MKDHYTKKCHKSASFYYTTSSTTKKDEGLGTQLFGVVYDNFEEALRAVGTFGRYQLYMCFLLLYSTIMWEGNLAIQHFNSQHPTWTCKTPEIMQEGTPPNQTYIAPANCAQMNQCRGHLEVKQRYFYSIVEEWGLECQGANAIWAIRITRSGAMFLGALIAGHIGDIFGRKRHLYVAQYCFCITAVLSIAARDWPSYNVAVALTGFFYAVVEVTGLTLALEMTDNKHRLIMNTCFQSAFANIIVAPIAYLTQKWRMYIIIINFITAPLLLGYLLVHESPRWVIHNGGLNRAATILSDIGSSRWNHRSVTIYGQQLRSISRRSNDKPHRRPNMFQLFLNPNLRRQSLLLTAALVTESWVHQAFHADLGKVVHNPFGGTALIGGIHMWLPFAVIALDSKWNKFGRRLLLLGSLAIMIACYAGIIGLQFIISRPNDDRMIAFDGMRTALTLIGDGCAQSAFILAIDQITVEYYPTVIRCIALGTFTAMGHLNSVVITVMQLCVEATDWKWVTVLICVIAETWAAFTWFVAWQYQEETKFMNLRETMADCEPNNMSSTANSNLHNSASLPICAVQKQYYNTYSRPMIRNHLTPASMSTPQQQSLQIQIILGSEDEQDTPKEGVIRNDSLNTLGSLRQPISTDSPQQNNNFQNRRLRQNESRGAVNQAFADDYAVI